MNQDPKSLNDLMQTWYRADTRAVLVSPVDVARETETQVVFPDGRRASKWSSTTQYFDNQRTAYRWLAEHWGRQVVELELKIRNATRLRDAARKRMESCKETLGMVQKA